MNYFIVGLLIGSIVTAIISFLLHNKVSKKIVKFHKKQSNDQISIMESKEQEITKLKAIVTELKKQIKYSQDQPDTTIQQETNILNQGEKNADLASILEAEIISIDENLKLQKIFFNTSEELPQEYLKLKEYLMNRQWQNADQETTKIMFELTKQKNSFLDVKDYPNLPLKDLAIIDGLWAYFSNGLFGFSAQYKAYSDICKGQEINQDKWRKIGDLLGWRKKDQWISSENDLIKSLDAPPGQYPFLPCWKGVWLGGFIDGQSDRFIALMIRFSDVFR